MSVRGGEGHLLVCLLRDDLAALTPTAWDAAGPRVLELWCAAIADRSGIVRRLDLAQVPDAWLPEILSAAAAAPHQLQVSRWGINFDRDELPHVIGALAGESLELSPANERQLTRLLARAPVCLDDRGLEGVVPVCYYHRR